MVLSHEQLYYTMVVLYYIPFSNLITGSLYSERKLVTRYKAKPPAYAMTPVWPLIRTPSGFSRDDSGWSLTPRRPHCDSVRLPASLLARKSGCGLCPLSIVPDTSRNRLSYTWYSVWYRSYASVRRVTFLCWSIKSKYHVYFYILVLFSITFLKQVKFLWIHT